MPAILFAFYHILAREKPTSLVILPQRVKNTSRHALSAMDAILVNHRHLEPQRPLLKNKMLASRTSAAPRAYARLNNTIHVIHHFSPYDEFI